MIGSGAKWAMLGLAVAGLIAAVFATSVGGASLPALAPSSGLHAAASDTYDFPGVPLTWNAGNLCHVQESGSNWSCDHSSGYGGFGGRGCGCSEPLTYNFSANNTTIWITISEGSSNNPAIFLNLHGLGNTVYLTVSGCSGGKLNFSILGQDNVVTFKDKASGMVASIQFYTDSDRYVASITGSHNQITTDFAGAFVLKDICPGKNQSSSDTYAITFGGRSNTQSIVYANNVGWSTGANSVGVGSGNTAVFANSTSFVCSWAIAPASTCGGHGGWGTVEQVLRADLF